MDMCADARLGCLLRRQLLKLPKRVRERSVKSLITFAESLSLVCRETCFGLKLLIITAARLASDSLDSPNLFSVTELEWFSRNSYNIAVQNCAIWEPSYVCRLLDACIQVCYQSRLSNPLSAAILADVLRTVDESVSAWLGCRRHSRHRISQTKLSFSRRCHLHRASPLL